MIPTGRYSLGDLARRSWRNKVNYFRRAAARQPVTQADYDRLQAATDKRSRKAEHLKKIAAAGGMAFS
jgi:hypothetical protein